MIDKEKATEYLRGLGMVSGESSVRAGYMALAMGLQEEMGAYKSINRYTSGTETLPQRMATEIGRDANYVHSHMLKWLATFKRVYDASDPKYNRICTPRMLEIITPLQLIYLLTCDFVDNG